MPETLDVGDRAGFYEGTGAYRDMVVTHLLQVLAFVAMEPPTALAPDGDHRGEEQGLPLAAADRPGRVVRGQYEGYRRAQGVAADSQTETFVALECEVDNWRWSGVPFFLRTGKRLAEGARIISIAFQEPPQSMFPAGSGVGEYGPDHLTFDLDESSASRFPSTASGPGPGCAGEAQHAVLARRERNARARRSRPMNA